MSDTSFELMHRVVSIQLILAPMQRQTGVARLGEQRKRGEERGRMYVRGGEGKGVC